MSISFPPRCSSARACSLSIHLPPNPSSSSNVDFVSHSFAIGYVYSFIAAGFFYWLFNRFAPHTESIMDHAETGEDIIAAQDAKNMQERRASWAEPGQKPNLLKRFFQV